MGWQRGHIRSWEVQSSPLPTLLSRPHTQAPLWSECVLPLISHVEILTPKVVIVGMGPLGGDEIMIAELS